MCWWSRGSDSCLSEYTHVHNDSRVIFLFWPLRCFSHFLPSDCHEICALVARTSVHYLSVADTFLFRRVMVNNILRILIGHLCWSQWPRGLGRTSLAARLLRLWVRIPPGAWMFVCCECCVLSGRGLCDGLIIRSEESYRLWRVVVCDQETS